MTDNMAIIRDVMTARAMAPQLEAFIDAHGLAAVCDALAFVCSEKAEHIRSNWQDEATAKVWDDMAGQLLGVEFKAVKVFR